MLQLRAVGRSIGYAVLALGLVAIVALASPASASPYRHHGASARRRVHGHHHIHSGHRGRAHQHRHRRHRAHRRGHQALSWEDRAQRLRSRGLENVQASIAPETPIGAGGFGASSLVAEARRFIGGNPTGRRQLWCARFMNMVLRRTGHRGTGSDLARSFASYGRRVPGPRVGAIAVMGRRGGGHVGVVSGIDAKGNPIIVSGNHGHRVAEAAYAKSRVYAYVLPN